MQVRELLFHHLGRVDLDPRKID